MCGIAGLHIKNPDVDRTRDAINLVADKLLLGIEQRGKHATGFVAVMDDKKVILDKAAVTATEFIQDREEIPENVRTLLLHTRYFTKGEPSVIGNNHPVVYKSCFTTHNGSIENDDDLFREFNLKRNYEVDTEIIPALLDKFGLGDMAHIKEALSKFRGPLAIATIDPVNHPHKLLLAKGVNSPLVVFENENMIMWASLQSAMKDAWGAVFGTPPRQDKFKHLSEGDIIVIDGDEVTRERYEVARPFRYGAAWERSSGVTGREPAWKKNQRDAKRRQAQIHRSGMNSGASGAALLWGSLASPFQNEQEFVNAVKWLREQGKGNARIWSNREKMDDAKDFSDVPADQGLSWVACKCGEAVLAQDIRKHLKYGNVCVDCYVVIRTRYDENTQAFVEANQATGTPQLALGRGSEDEPKYRALPEKDRKNMESWSSVEANAHILIVRAVAQDSGYSPELIDFLVFRTGEMAADFGAAMIDLKTQLTRAYEAFTVEVWENHGEELLEGITQEQGASQEHYDSAEHYSAYTVKKPGGVSEVWYNCHTHGESFRAGEDCPTCLKVEDAVDDILKDAAKDKQQCDECGLEFPRYQLRTMVQGGENYLLCQECNKYFCDPCQVDEKKEEAAEETAKLEGLSRCYECKTFISKDYPCKVCAIRSTQEPEPVPIDRLVNIKPENVSKCKGNGSSGKQCRRKVMYCIGNIGGYCKRHYESCGENRCTKQANTVLADGRRACHGHARGQEGAYADKMLLKSGVVFQEVRG